MYDYGSAERIPYKRRDDYFFDYGSAAPLREFEPKRAAVKKPDVIVYEGESHNTYEVKNVSEKTSKINVRSIVASLLACVFFFGSVCLFIYLKSSNEAMIIKTAQLKNEIEDLESININLKAERDRRRTVDKVKEYAENKLGMVKLENYKMSYINSNIQTNVVLCGGKSYRDKDLLGTLKAFVSSIFSGK